MRIFLVGLLVACSNVAPAGDDAPSTPCAIEGVTGSLPGVTLAIRSDSCVYKRGTPAVFTYEVAITDAVPALNVPDGGAGCGSCDLRTTDPLSWTGWIINGTSETGAQQQYCLCDTGCCPPDRAATIRPAITTASATIMWSGRTWYGPSDTGNPMGEFFEVGTYAVRVGFSGYDQGSVSAVLPIEIVD